MYTKEQIEEFEIKVINRLLAWMKKYPQDFCDIPKKRTFTFDYQKDELGRKSHAVVKIKTNAKKKPKNVPILEEFQVVPKDTDTDTEDVISFEIFITPEDKYKLFYSITETEFSLYADRVFDAGLEDAIGVNNCYIEDMIQKVNAEKEKDTIAWLRDMMEQSNKALITLEQLLYARKIPMSDLSKELLTSIIVASDLSSYIENFYVETHKLTQKAYPTETINEKEYYVIPNDTHLEETLLNSASYIELDADRIRENIVRYGCLSILDTQIDSDEELKELTDYLVFEESVPFFENYIETEIGYVLSCVDIQLHDTDDGILIINHF
jgi:hypothetical protein